MAGIVTKVHARFAIAVGPVDRYVPPTMQIRQEPDDGGGKPAVPQAVAFQDPDGETHVYVLSDETRRGLIAKLTGGIMVPP